MIRNEYRIGNFTSSEIVALTTTGKGVNGFGSPAITYINETNMERRLGRSISDEVSAKALTWGKLVELRVFNLLGLEYILSSTDTIQHPTIPYWAGSKDGIKHDEGKTIIDIKSPLTLKSFCQLVQPLYDGLTGMAAMNAIRNGYVDKDGKEQVKHKDGEKFYWQLVSNSILDNTKFAELIVYMPYEHELDEIRIMAQEVEPENLHKHYWIAMANPGELPFINIGGYYNNLNTIRFEVPQSDKDFLTSCVLKAGKMLIGNEDLSVSIKPTITLTKLKTA